MLPRSLYTPCLNTPVRSSLGWARLSIRPPGPLSQAGRRRRDALIRALVRHPCEDVLSACATIGVIWNERFIRGLRQGNSLNRAPRDHRRPCYNMCMVLIHEDSCWTESPHSRPHLRREREAEQCSSFKPRIVFYDSYIVSQGAMLFISCCSCHFLVCLAATLYVL